VQRWADRQCEFAVALLDPALPVPPGLVGPDGEASPRRFSVYRNNVVVSLIGALETNFPAVCRIVGEEFFRAMARAYVIAEPPVSPILLDYGAGFPNFIAGFEAAATSPYLADVARIERAWAEAYHAREAAALDPAVLAAIPPNRAAEIRLAVHPSLRIVRSQFPALTIWRMNVANGVPSQVDFDSGGEDALVIRTGAEVEVRSMPQGGAEFVEALASGKILAEAAKSALTADPFFDLPANLAALIGAGIFVGYSLIGDAIGDEFDKARDIAV
jgi:Putative DNA-binding domain